MLFAFLLLFALHGQDTEGNCSVPVRGRLVFPAYSTPINQLSVTGHKLDPPGGSKTVITGPDDVFDFGSIQSAKRYALEVHVEGMEGVWQNFYVPANHSPFACFGSPGIQLEILLHPVIKPSAMAEDTVGIEALARKTPGKTVEAFEKSMDKKPKTPSREMSTTLKEVLNTAPDFYEANLELGLEYKTADQREDAIKTLTHALELNSGSMLARSALGQYSFDAGDFQKAAELLDEAAHLGSTSPDDYYMLGTSYYKLNRLDIAEASLLRALAINPTIGKAYLQLYNVYMRNQAPEKALKAVDTYLEKYPDAKDREYVQSMADKLRQTRKPNP